MIVLNLTGERISDLEYAPLEQAVACLNTILTAEGEVNLRLTDDTEIQQLNRQYAGNDYPTDVLSFSYREDGSESGELGDIAISLETAARQAVEAGTSLSEEVALLLIHGILHVLGYDHQDDDEIERLDQLQRDIMNSAKLPYRNFQWA